MPERLVRLKVDEPTPEYNLKEAQKKEGEVAENGDLVDDPVARQNTSTEMFLNEQGGVATAASPGGENENTTSGPTDASPADKAIESGTVKVEKPSTEKNEKPTDKDKTSSFGNNKRR